MVHLDHKDNKDPQANLVQKETKAQLVMQELQVHQDHQVNQALQEHQAKQDHLDLQGYRVSLVLQELQVQMEQMGHLVPEVMLGYLETKDLRALQVLKDQEANPELWVLMAL